MQDVPQLHGTKKRKTICLLFTHHYACSDALKTIRENLWRHFAANAHQPSRFFDCLS